VSSLNAHLEKTVVSNYFEIAFPNLTQMISNLYKRFDINE